jgi:hypothetical protein
MTSENSENHTTGHSSDTSDKLQRYNAPNERSCAEEITRLHNEIRQHAETMLLKAYRIGELLVEQKQKMQHGQFTQWVTDHWPFSVRTAQNYMKVFLNKDQLKNENVSLLSDAYNILKLPRDTLKEAGDEDEKRYFITISVHEEHKELFKDVLDIAKQQLNTESNSIAIMYIMYDWGMSVLPDPNRNNN